MKKFSLILSLLFIAALQTFGQETCLLQSMRKTSDDVAKTKMLDRLLRYLSIESQSEEPTDPASFPMTEGQRTIARLIFDEVRGFGGKDVKVLLSDNYYLYIDIPSNIEVPAPSILFLAHMDVTPEANGKGIRPQVHYNYDGGDIALTEGVTLSPNMPQGKHLSDLVGKTIVTSDGTTLLGADDKTGVAVLVTMVEEILKDTAFRHPHVMVCLSQNEDVGLAAEGYEPEVFGICPDVVVDLDADTYNEFSVGNFTAECFTYYFRGNSVHPSHGKEFRYADALTAASYFVGLLPPELHPSASEGTDPYIHCYSMTHPNDSLGHPIDTDYVLKVRLRYFQKADGNSQHQILTNNLHKTQEAFPFVEISKTNEVLQYENVAYTQPEYVPDLIQKAARDGGMEMTPKHARGGTTSAMLLAKFPNAIRGGSDFYSGQNAEHSVLEWCCVEELCQLVGITKNMISECINLSAHHKERIHPAAR